MAIPHLVVQPTSAARSQLSSALAHFRQDGVNAEPLVFGSHRQAEGVVIPFELFKEIYPAIEDARSAALLRERIADDKPRTTLEDVITELGFDSSDFTLD